MWILIFTLNPYPKKGHKIFANKIKPNAKYQKKKKKEPNQRELIKKCPFPLDIKILIKNKNNNNDRFCDINKKIIQDATLTKPKWRRKIQYSAKK